MIGNKEETECCNSIQLNWIHEQQVFCHKRWSSIVQFPYICFIRCSLCVFQFDNFSCTKVCIEYILHFSPWHTLNNCMVRPNLKRFVSTNFAALKQATDSISWKSLSINAIFKLRFIKRQFSPLFVINSEWKLQVIFPKWML